MKTMFGLTACDRLSRLNPTPARAREPAGVAWTNRRRVNVLRCCVIWSSLFFRSCMLLSNCVRTLPLSFDAREMNIKFAAAMLTALAALASVEAIAQQYPVRPMRFLVGSPPGSGNDLVSRLLGQKLSERLGQPVVVENRPGGAGLLANDALAKSPPDGHTLVLLSGAHPATAALNRALPYDPVRDFGMVGTVVAYPLVISVAPDSPIRSFADLIERAKTAPGKLTYSMTPGPLVHLLGEWINTEADAARDHRAPERRATLHPRDAAGAAAPRRPERRADALEPRGNARARRARDRALEARGRSEEHRAAELIRPAATLVISASRRPGRYLPARTPRPRLRPIRGANPGRRVSPTRRSRRPLRSPRGSEAPRPQW